MPLNSPEIALGSLFAIGVALAIAQIVYRSFGFYKKTIDREIVSSRYHAIDGLRGFLAIGVVLHHIHINHHFYLTGGWELTPSRLSTLLGRGSVAMFFMITAFLFWGRVIDSKTRFEAIRFYQNRVLRLVPMYFMSAALVVVTAMALTHFRLNVPLVDLATQIGAWLLFTFPGVPPINGFAQTPLINTVFWSLIYEWKFYLVLPLIGALAIRWGIWLVALGVCACIALFSPTQVEWYFRRGLRGGDGSARSNSSTPLPERRRRGTGPGLHGSGHVLATAGLYPRRRGAAVRAIPDHRGWQYPVWSADKQSGPSARPAQLQHLLAAQLGALPRLATGQPLCTCRIPAAHDICGIRRMRRWYHRTACDADLSLR